MASTPMASNFTSIPVLDYSQSQGASKPKFIAELREVLTSIGFMQLRNSSVPWSVVTKVLSYADALFNLPMKDKLAFSMSQTPHFLGYNQLGWEITKGAMDLREQVDLAPDYETKWRPGLPIHLRVHGPGVWPKETKENGLIGFREAVLEYITGVTNLSYDFLKLVEEAVGLKPGALDVFADEQTRQGGSIKLVKYPPPSAENPTDQGVGPHKDPYITFLVQGDNLPGLQVENGKGEWIDVPPMEGCFVVNFGTLLETATHGRIIATTHRVVSPPAHLNKSRISMPFFQRIALDALLLPLPASSFINPPSTASFQKSDAAPEQYPGLSGDSPIWGQLYLWNRLRSHPDVGYRHYPDLMGQVMEGFRSEHPVEVARREGRSWEGQAEEERQGARL